MFISISDLPETIRKAYATRKIAWISKGRLGYIVMTATGLSETWIFNRGWKRLDRRAIGGKRYSGN